MHGGDALQGQVVVHHGEHALLHLAAVPGVEDDLLTGGDVEDGGGLGVQPQLLVVGELGLGSVVGDEIGLEVLQLLLGGGDEHVLDEVGLPCHLHDEADGHAGVRVGAAEHVHHVELLVGQLLDGQVLAGLPGLLGGGLVVVLELVRGPPDGVLGVLVHDDELILRGAAGVDAGHDVDCAQLSQLTLLKALQAGVHLRLEELLVGGVVDDFLDTGNAVLFQSVSFHSCVPPYGIIQVDLSRSACRRGPAADAKQGIYCFQTFPLDAIFTRTFPILTFFLRKRNSETAEKSEMGKTLKPPPRRGRDNWAN